MITKTDYAELIEKFLDAEQPNYTYLENHRTAVLCLIDAAPRAMRDALIRPLIKEAFLPLSEESKDPSPNKQMKWRYELLRRLARPGDYAQRFLDCFATKQPGSDHGFGDYLVWIDVIARQFGITLSGRYLLAVVEHHHGHYDKQTRLARAWLSGDPLDVVLFRIQRNADRDARDQAERDYWNSPG